MAIYVNQVGYFTRGRKVALSTRACNYQIIRTSDSKCVYDGVASVGKYDESAREEVFSIDFDEVCECGRYYVLAGNGERSVNFEIKDNLYDDVLTDSMRCLYYQRCGMELEAQYAGEYVHPACHLRPVIMLEDYINKTENPFEYDMSGGWHDAGDYGRYVSAGAVAVGHILYAYELFPDRFTGSLNIPESGNGIPDILNECYYELSFLLKMQDADGGVHHKLTAYNHPDFIMPQDDLDPFYIFPVSSLATADFAAVMALAARIYRDFMPEFSEIALDAARLAAWWLEEHDYVGFHNPEGCNTGEYDDDDDVDERLWAYAELVRTDNENRSKYMKRLNEMSVKCSGKTDFGWTDVSGFASLCILTDPKMSAGKLYDQYKKIVIDEACRLKAMIDENGYLVGMKPDDYVWGSNMVVLNRGMLLALADMISVGDDSGAYRESVIFHLDYIFGRNAMDTSYVTGYGEHAFKNPHARVTECDGIDAPMPGWVSGGPFKAPCDPAALEALKPDTAPMKCYVDHVGSYSTNEITIYWNSPLIFLCAYL